MAVVELSFTPLPEHVRTARLVLVGLARRAGVAEGVLEEVRLAVDEACSRAVRVQRAADPAELVSVEVDDGGPWGDTFTVSVRDTAPAGELVAVAGHGLASAAGLVADHDVAAPEADPQQSLPAGFELALLLGLVDEVTVTPGPEDRGTTVRMDWPRTRTADGRSGSA